MDWEGWKGGLMGDRGRVEVGLLKGLRVLSLFVCAAFACVPDVGLVRPACLHVLQVSTYSIILGLFTV